MSSGECHQSSNVLCKHVRSTISTYLNLDDRLPAGVAITSATADSEDLTLEVVSVEVVTEDTVITNAGCSVNLLADRAILVKVAGGAVTSDDSETVLTVNWVQDDGDEDSVDCRLMIGGSTGS